MLPAWDHLTSEIILPHQITTKGSSFALGPYSTIQGQKSTRNVHSFLTDWFSRLLGGDKLGAWWWRVGEGESGRPGAWPTTLQILIRFVCGFLPN
eukprot:1158001-Pelagomonas_calceolata.AAC.5